MGSWVVTWMLGDWPAGLQRLRAISSRTFQKSLRISDARFLIHDEKTGVRITRQLPPLEGPAESAPASS